MFQLLKTKPSSMLGIDLRPFNFKLLELSYVQERLSVLSYAAASIPGPLSDTELLEDPEVLIQGLQSLLSQKSLKSKQVALALPDTLVMIKRVQIPAELVPKSLKEFVMLQAEQSFPYPLEKLNLDFELLGPCIEHDSMLDLLLVATQADQIHRLVSAIQAVGLTLKVVDVASFALERAAQWCLTDLRKYSKRLVVFIELGFIDAQVLIFKESLLIDSFGLKTGGREGVDLRTTFLRQIQARLQDFASIHQIFISGAYVRQESLDVWIQEQLGLPTCFADPLKQLLIHEGLDEEGLRSESSALMLAYGLALRGIKYNASN